VFAARFCVRVDVHSPLCYRYQSNVAYAREMGINVCEVMRGRLNCLMRKRPQSLFCGGSDEQPLDGQLSQHWHSVKERPSCAATSFIPVKLPTAIPRAESQFSVVTDSVSRGCPFFCFGFI